MDNFDTDIYFEFKTYKEFRKERLKLNYDNTLKLWYALPNVLPTNDNNRVRRQTPKQQRARLRKMKFFAFYSIFLKKTFLKKKIHSKVHFDGKQSNVAELNLPSSLQPQANRIVKIFDMIKFIENDWRRGGEHESVYMGLATIHESQMKSTLQHARTEDDYAPTMAQVEQVSAEKGGATLIAAGLLIEGRLTRAKMAYLEYLGFGLQLLDDLQDVKEDMKNNHRTIFTQTLAEDQTLDAPTARLIQYCYCKPAFETFSDDQRTVSDRKTGVTLAEYIRVSMMMFSIVLILEAASQLQEYYSKEFYRELSSLSPVTFKDLKPARIEERVWAIVRNQRL
ncbi:unnamed protein product [Rotaria sp. Silwood1]|nr:unnamed protein product [Rotaria sp. Silwood1]